MKEKLIGWMNSRRYNSHLMRLIVGGYVSYLGFQIILDLYKKGQFELGLVLCALLLLIAGLPVAAISLYAVIFGYSLEYKGKVRILERGLPRETPDEEETEED